MNWSIVKKIVFMAALVWGLIGLIIVAFVFFIGMQRRNEARVMGKDAPESKEQCSESLSGCGEFEKIVTMFGGPIKYRGSSNLGDEVKERTLSSKFYYGSYGVVDASKSKLFNFHHFCAGDLYLLRSLQVDQLPEKVCIGENILAVEEGKAVPGQPAQWLPWQTLKTVFIESKDARYHWYTLKDVQKLPSEVALISFTDHGDATNGLGHGGPARNNFITGYLKLSDGSYHDLENVPGYGNLMWNAAGTKAIIVPSSCNEGGCYEVAVMGYDLFNDALKQVTVKTAAKDKDSNEADWDDETHSYKRKLSYWENVHWVNNDTMNATIVNTNGTREKLEAKF